MTTEQSMKLLFCIIRHILSIHELQKRPPLFDTLIRAQRRARINDFQYNSENLGFVAVNMRRGDMLSSFHSPSCAHCR